MPNNLPNSYQPIVFNEQVFSCRLVSNADLAGNLEIKNENSGLGTTLTNSGTLAALSIDSTTPDVGDRVLLIAQTATEQNGLWIVSEIGSINTPWILTRAPDWCSVDQMKTGQYLTIEDGVALKGNMYVFVRPFPGRINYDPINWVAVAFSSGGSVNSGLINQIAYYAASGNTLSGTSTLPALVQVHPVNLNSGTSASASTFYRGDDTWASISSAVVPVGNVRFVSPNGDDTTGNGTINFPWQTIVFALSQITTAASTNIFKIYCLTDNYVENSLVLKPWIFIDGSDSTLRVNGTITADASFSSGGNVLIENFSEVITFSGMNFDVSTAGINGVAFTLKNISGAFISPISFTGSGSGTVINFVNYASNTSPTLNNCRFNFIDYLGFDINADYITLSENYTCTINNAFLNGGINLTGDGTPTCNLTISNCSSINTISATGANMNLLIASDSLTTSSVPTLSGGATVSYYNISNAITANYTPTNYTPDATGATSPSTSVAAHLHGIDNAIGSKTLIWSEVTGTSQAAAVNHAYITNNAGLVTVVLPSLAAVGDRVAIQGKGAGGWSMAANAGQSIIVGNTSSSVDGSVSSTNRYDSIEVVCTTANTTWSKTNIGNYTIV